MSKRFTTFSSSKLLFLSWRGCGSGKRNSLICAVIVLNLLYSLPTMLHELNAICIHFPWKGWESENSGSFNSWSECWKRFRMGIKKFPQKRTWLNLLYIVMRFAIKSCWWTLNFSWNFSHWLEKLHQQEAEKLDYHCQDKFILSWLSPQIERHFLHNQNHLKHSFEIILDEWKGFQ